MFVEEREREKDFCKKDNKVEENNFLSLSLFFCAPPTRLYDCNYDGRDDRDDDDYDDDV